MTQLDIFYRSYENYKKELLNNREDHLFKKAAYTKNRPIDFVSKVNVECHINDDWIKAIERAIPYLEKCIKEDRQFIKNEGEVLPIEKIRRVSKDSVSDLAKHSDYITKIPEDTDDLIPEKLLMITRDADYKIYENRVLYAALTYLRDFISTRLEKIIQSINKYEGKIYIKKKIELHNRQMDFLMDISEKRFEDPIAIKKSKCADLIERIKLELNDILVLLKTPLMVECSKAPLVSRPITKTNILKMNINFKEALAIFDFCVEYPGDGFELEEKEVKIYPLSETQTNAFSDIIQLSSFLAYEYNNNLEDELLEEYKKEDIRRKKAEEDELIRRMEEMFNKAKNSEKEFKEYIFLLEEGTRIFKERLEETKQEMAKLVAEHEQVIEDLKRQHEEALAQAKQEYSEMLIFERERCEEKIRKINEENIANIEQLKAQHESVVNELTSQLNDQKQENFELRGFVEKANKEVEEIRQAAQEEVTQMFNMANKEIELAQAETLALRLQDRNPPLPGGFTSKDRFEQLEAEIMTLNDFEKKVWSQAKIEIRNEYFRQIKSDEPIKKPKQKVKKHFKVSIDYVENSDSPEEESVEQKKFFDFTSYRREKDDELKKE